MAIIHRSSLVEGVPYCQVHTACPSRKPSRKPWPWLFLMDACIQSVCRCRPTCMQAVPLAQNTATCPFLRCCSPIRLAGGTFATVRLLARSSCERAGSLVCVPPPFGAPVQRAGEEFIYVHRALETVRFVRCSCVSRRRPGRNKKEVRARPGYVRLSARRDD